MKDNIIIDCHMHALTREDFKIYMKTACAKKYINIRGLYIDEMLDPYDFDEFINNENMYFIDSVDLNSVEQELNKIEKDIEKYPRIIGIKLYLGYQKYYANDERIERVANFAGKHHLSVTFHCGEIYDENGKSSFTPYSDAKYIEDLVIKYPNVNFIASHINWPNFDSLFYLCDKYKNVYTCFSGCNDGENKVERDKQNMLIADVLNKYFRMYPSVKKKVMYGTDFFAVSDEYNDVSSYINIVDLLEINGTEKNDIVYNNVCEAYHTEFK